MIEWWMDGMLAHVQNNFVEWLSIRRVGGMEYWIMFNAGIGDLLFFFIVSFFVLLLLLERI